MRAVDPTAQLIAVTLIRSLVAGVPVGTYYPRAAPERMIVVARHGGLMRTPITDGATISVQVYADTQHDAETLAGSVRHALLAADWAGRRIHGHLLRGWREYAGPQRFTDPDQPTKTRFQFSGELLVSTLTR